MKVTLLSAAIAAAMLTAGMAQASPDLAKSAGCAKCHEMDKTKKGAPGFKETAAQYKGKADAEATILKNSRTTGDAFGRRDQRPQGRPPGDEGQAGRDPVRGEVDPVALNPAAGCCSRPTKTALRHPPEFDADQASARRISAAVMRLNSTRCAGIMAYQ